MKAVGGSDQSGSCGSRRGHGSWLEPGSYPIRVWGEEVAHAGSRGDRERLCHSVCHPSQAVS